MSFKDRHAPKTFADLVFADQNVQQTLALYANRKLHDSIILHGGFGTGKSMTSEIIAIERKRVLGQTGPFTGTLNAATLGPLPGSLIGPLNHELNYIGTSDAYLVLDEVDQLTPAKQLQLRALIDNYEPLKLIMTTNNINKIDRGIISRSAQFHIDLPAYTAWRQRAQSILRAEGIELSPERVEDIIKASKDVRDIIRSLDRFVTAFNESRRNFSQMLPGSSTADGGNGNAAFVANETNVSSGSEP